MAIFDGTEDADTLTGGTGADEFIVKTGFDIDTVTDFENGLDVMNFLGMGATFDTLGIDNITNGVIVIFGSDGFILEGITLEQINASDFLFGV